MTEEEIRASGMHLIGALAKDDNKAAQTAGVKLAVNLLVDLNRIATALTQLAMEGIKR